MIISGDVVTCRRISRSDNATYEIVPLFEVDAPFVSAEEEPDKRFSSNLSSLLASRCLPNSRWRKRNGGKSLFLSLIFKTFTYFDNRNFFGTINFKLCVYYEKLLFVRRCLRELPVWTVLRFLQFKMKYVSILVEESW